MSTLQFVVGGRKAGMGALGDSGTRSLLGGWRERLGGARVLSFSAFRNGTILILASATGCTEKQHTQSIEPLQKHPPLLVAVAPALNLSGSADFDPVRVAELMAVELESFPSVDAIPVSRSLAILMDEGWNEVASASEAQRLMERLGADAILVFGVTAYEPYEPPIVGIAAELYGSSSEGFDADVAPDVAAGGTGTLDGSSGAAAFGTLAQISTVYDASHERVVEAVKEFAEERGAGDTPLGWRRILASQTEYVEFCCHETARRLLNSVDRVQVTAKTAMEEGGS